MKTTGRFGCSACVCAVLLFLTAGVDDALAWSGTPEVVERAGQAGATDQFENVSSRLDEGDEVTVMAIDGDRVKGRIVDLSGASISVATRSQPRGRMFSEFQVARILRRDPTGNGVKIGAIIGGVTGLVGGLAVNSICVSEAGACVGAVVALTAMGAGIGAGAGWGFDAAIGNEVVFDRTASLSGEDTSGFPERRFRVWGGLDGGGNFDQGSGQIGMSGGAGLAFSSGVTVEGELYRTVTSGARHIPCVRHRLVGGCVGEGDVGTESLTLATGRVVYTLTRSRVQPFVTAGVSHVTGVRLFPDPYSSLIGPPQVVQRRSRQDGVYLPIGGGVQVSLARGLEARGEIVYYVDPTWNGAPIDTRVSGGIRYSFEF